MPEHQQREGTRERLRRDREAMGEGCCRRCGEPARDGGILGLITIRDDGLCTSCAWELSRG